MAIIRAYVYVECDVLLGKFRRFSAYIDDCVFNGSGTKNRSLIHKISDFYVEKVFFNDFDDYIPSIIAFLNFNFSCTTVFPII